MPITWRQQTILLAEGKARFRNSVCLLQNTHVTCITLWQHGSKTKQMADLFHEICSDLEGKSVQHDH